jgi:hypothetical protein
MQWRYANEENNLAVSDLLAGDLRDSAVGPNGCLSGQRVQKNYRIRPWLQFESVKI